MAAALSAVIGGLNMSGCFDMVVQELTVEEEVRAAHNVLEACAQTDVMERVVFTSSLTAVVWNGDADKEEHLAVDERCWSDLAFCRKFKVRACHSLTSQYRP